MDSTSGEKPDLKILHDNRDLLVAFYNSARAELICRIGERDQALRLYATFVGAVLGVSLAQPRLYLLLVTLPYVGLAAAVIATQHHVVIGNLGEYCSEELGVMFKRMKLPFPQWDTSDGLRRSTPPSMIFRLIADVTLIWIPSFVGLLLNGYRLIVEDKNLPVGLTILTATFAGGLACMILTSWITIRGSLRRIMSYRSHKLWGQGQSIEPSPAPTPALKAKPQDRAGK